MIHSPTSSVSIEPEATSKSTAWARIRLAIGVLASALVIYGLGLLFMLTGFPLSLDPTLAVQSFENLPLPHGVAIGDRADWARMPPDTRAAFTFNGRFAAGREFSAAMLHDGVPYTAKLPIVPFEFDLASRFSWVLVSAAFFFVLELVLGLLILWRGRDWAAWGLGVQALSQAVLSALDHFPVHGWQDAYAMTIVSEVLIPAIAWSGLFAMAYTLVGSNLSRPWRRVFCLLFGAAVLARGTLGAINDWGIVVWGWSPYELDGPIRLLWAARAGTVILLLLIGLFIARTENRLRLKWITASLALMQVPNVLTAFWPNLNASMLWQLVQTLVILAAVVGLLYAVLRHRLVDIRLVLNRAVVYALITTAVVGIFALLENTLEQQALGSQASMLLQLGVPLAMGIAINALHKRIENFIERMLFRRAHHAEQSLLAFGRRSAFIESESALIRQTVEEIHRHSGALFVRWYDRDADAPHDYQLIGLSGDENGALKAISADDPALVALRADPVALDLAAVSGALGRDGLILPIARSGLLTGALLCGPRAAEGYSPDERRLLSRVAQEAGAALRDLRALKSERLLEALVDGRVEPGQARLLASSLLGRRAVSARASA